MNTSPTENRVFGIVTFTERGDAALERLADALVAGCDGSPDGIADILERVLDTPVEDLAECLRDTTQPDVDPLGHGIHEIAPVVESPDEAARRRLGASTTGGCLPDRTIAQGQWSARQHAQTDADAYSCPSSATPPAAGRRLR
ncbi:hypothetical protein ACFQW6_07435 [Nocardioides sp. GCM10028917]|uniref:hypothetical protein n=1 Tax=Nocardioides sp. GCM10028917 TaxID=3273408 RepID=UPI00360F0FB2